MRRAMYTLSSLIIVLMIIAYCVHQYHIYQYQNAVERLEAKLRADGRFPEVRVIFYSTRPSAWILAPDNLSSSEKQDLNHIVVDTFGTLQVPIRYAGPQFFNKTNDISVENTNRMNN